MQLGSDYKEGEILQQGPYSEPIRLVWYDDYIPDDVFLVVGASSAFLTIYVAKSSARMAPRLARFIPQALFAEVAKLKADIVTKGRKKKKEKPKNILSEPVNKAMPAPSAPDKSTVVVASKRKQPKAPPDYPQPPKRRASVQTNDYAPAEEEPVVTQRKRVQKRKRT